MAGLDGNVAVTNKSGISVESTYGPFCVSHLMITTNKNWGDGAADTKLIRK